MIPVDPGSVQDAYPAASEVSTRPALRVPAVYCKSFLMRTLSKRFVFAPNEASGKRRAKSKDLNFISLPSI